MNVEEKISVFLIAIFGFNNLVEINVFLETILLSVSIIAGCAGLFQHWRKLKQNKK